MMDLPCCLSWITLACLAAYCPSPEVRLMFKSGAMNKQQSRWVFLFRALSLRSTQPCSIVHIKTAYPSQKPLQCPLIFLWKFHIVLFFLPHQKFCSSAELQVDFHGSSQVNIQSSRLKVIVYIVFMDGMGYKTAGGYKCSFPTQGLYTSTHSPPSSPNHAQGETSLKASW